MFAIIDIETCGGKFEFRRGHIIDICILIHDGLQVVDKFSTFINPQCNIAPFYTKLSGITNEMVKDAPAFPEVAKKIIEMTEGKIFVAHNVGFDYGFVKDEFAALGYKYKRDTLCTVRLSRKLMPGKVSYSLGNLCDSLGIENKARHRAEGDAEATAILFNKLLELKAIDPQHKNKGVEELMVRRIDKIKEYVLRKLPEACGVYYFLDKDGKIIYVGKSRNMYNRALSHFNSREYKGKKMLNDLYNVDFVITGSELIALLLESEEIKKHKPRYNRARKGSDFSHCIDVFKDTAGIINFKIVPFEQSERPLLSFTGYASARDRLEQWIDEKVLCLRYCNLVSEDAVCFDHQIKKCNGICCGEEDIDDYNKRAGELVARHSYEKENFIVFDKGKARGEKSLVYVKEGKYYGYGYLSNENTVSSVEELEYAVKKQVYYPDSDLLVQGYLKSKPRKVLSL